MFRVHERGRLLLSLVVASATFATQGCYGTRPQPKSIVWHNSGYDFQEKGSLQIGVQRTVREAGGGTPDVAFHAEETPICASRRVGKADVTLTNYKDVRRGLTVPLRIVLFAGSVTAVALGTKHMIEGDKVRGGIMLGVGGLATIINLAKGTLPATKEVEDRTTLPVTLLPSQPDQWHACGEAKPVQTDVALTFEARGKRWETTARTDANGVLQLPAAMTTDLGAWSQACGTDIRLTASIPGGADGLEKARWGLGLDRKVADDQYLELGKNGGQPTTAIYAGAPASLVLAQGPHLTRIALSGTTPSTYARTCLQETKEKQHQSCLAAESARNQASCEQSCVSTEKREECAVRNEICVEQTAGIAALQSDCAARLNSCLVSVQQDGASVQRCTQACQSTAAARACSDG